MLQRLEPVGHRYINLSKKGDIDFIKDYYHHTDLAIHFVSALSGTGMNDFMVDLQGRLSIFTGYSGVGKSTILNALFPGVNLATNEVSESTGKGIYRSFKAIKGLHGDLLRTARNTRNPAD